MVSHGGFSTMFDYRRVFDMIKPYFFLDTSWPTSDWRPSGHINLGGFSRFSWMTESEASFAYLATSNVPCPYWIWLELLISSWVPSGVIFFHAGAGLGQGWKLGCHKTGYFDSKPDQSTSRWDVRFLFSSFFHSCFSMTPGVPGAVAFR